MSNIQPINQNVNVNIDINIKKNSIEENEEKTIEEQIAEAILKSNPKRVTLQTDENGHIIIDKDLHPDIYDWAVNG